LHLTAADKWFFTVVKDTVEGVQILILSILGVIIVCDDEVIVSFSIIICVV
jgi:hypothetical protein